MYCVKQEEGDTFGPILMLLMASMYRAQLLASNCSPVGILQDWNFTPARNAGHIKPVFTNSSSNIICKQPH